jgi:hypothetical protein
MVFTTRAEKVLVPKNDINGVVDSWMHILDYPTETGSTHTTVHIGTYRMYPYAFNLELPVLVLWLHFYRSRLV